MAELSIFEKISQRIVPGFIIDETPTHIAFLTIGPIAKAHTLVVPKKNLSDNLFQLSDQDYCDLLLYAKKISHLLENRVECSKVAMFVVGDEVPHVHIHLVPYAAGFSFENIKIQNPSSAELAEIHKQLTS